MIIHNPIFNKYQYNNAVTNLGAAFNPKKAGAIINKAKLYVVIDYSSSMQSCREQTIAGYNAFLEKQQADKTIHTDLYVYKFDGNSVINIYSGKVEYAPKLTYATYNPSGNTNLNDAIGSVIQTANNTLDGEIVNIVILTDGAENNSTIFKNSDIKQMVAKADEMNWSFLFLGANIDAFSVGSQLGFSRNNTWQYDTKNIGDTFVTASAHTTAMRGSIAAGMSTTLAYNTNNISDDTRKKLNGESV